MSITALKTMKAKSNKKIDVAGITKSTILLDFSKNSKAIFERYFKYDNRHLTRVHIPQLTKEEYEAEVKRYTGKVSIENTKYEDATAYFKQKMAKERFAKDLGINSNKLDFSNYLWNDDYFICDDLMISSDYVDNKFMEEPKENPTAHDVYVKFDTHQASLDKELFDELYRFCDKAIANRKAMLLMKVEQCVSTLVNIIEQSNGFSMNISGNTLRTLQYYKEYFTELFEDKEYAEFLKNNNDITVYAEDLTTHSDYIDTYALLVKKLVGVKSEDKYMEDYLRSVLYNADDNYIDEIIAHCFTVPDKPISYVEEFEDTEY